ncbi:MAG: rRNA pseudouridine synthase [Bdellovibrionales bacterium]|nr:rRNA pseudouridine synthase [Bdellovibrionales bacterium]
MSEDLVRLSKLMSERGLCSRREADDLIAKGLVKVDGQVVNQLGTKVLPSVKIEVVGRGQKTLDEKVTILINKPKGYVSSQPEDGYRGAVDLVTRANQDPSDPRPYHAKFLHGLAPAGRLDIDSQGLLVMTQDGVVAKRLIGENSDVEKEYIVRVIGRLSDAGLKRLCDGSLVIEGRKLRPAQVEWINEDQLRFILKEGMKRQIRKMCEAVGLKVIGLKRVRIGKVTLSKLPEGKWRTLRKGEEF